MREAELRNILLIDAIEDHDREGTMLPRADREQATRQALRQFPLVAADLDPESMSPRALAALAHRSAALGTRLESRFPVVRRLVQGLEASRWLDLALLAVALLLGASMATIDAGRRINILAFPLLGLVAWNLVVYLLLAIAWMRRRLHPGHGPGGAAAWYSRFIAGRARTLTARTAGFHAILAQALGTFAQQWGAFGGRLLLARARRLLHLAAALVAIGLVAGLYARGVLFQYEAGWESTFLGAAQVRPLLAVAYGPASVVTGIPVPSTVAEVEALRWTGAGSGVGAAPWIHLLAVTALLFIVLPRMLAALAAHLALRRLSASVPVPVTVQDYARRVFGRGVGVPGHGIVAVTPYGGDPGAGSRRGIEALLLAVFGDDATVDLRPAVRYGDEDAWLESLAQGSGRIADCHVLLFDLASTPETENHGAMLSGIRDWLGREHRRGRLLVIVDQGGYAARLGTGEDGRQRLAERRGLWQRFVAAQGLEAVFAGLAGIGDAPDADHVARARAAVWIAEATA